MGLLNINKYKKRELESPIMIIDSAFLFHAKLVSAYNEYQISMNGLPLPQEDIHKYDWASDVEYMKMLENFSMHNVKRLMERYNILPKNLIIAVDCPRSSIWRKRLYPTYKDNRDVSPEDQEGKPNFASVWKVIKSTMIPNIASKLGGTYLFNKFCEGDDIMAIVKNYIREKQPERKIIIIASDSDLIQLHDEHTEIYDLWEKDVIESTFNKYNISYGTELITLKAICGDKKDNVPSCGTRIGIETARKMLNNQKLYDDTMKKFPEATKIIKLNKILLDFNHIPTPLKESVEAELKEKILLG